MTLAIVPAGGRSTRMGRPKLTLPLAGRSVIEHVVSALRRGGCSIVSVVGGPHVPDLATLAAGAGAHVCYLSKATADMRETVEHGLLSLETRFQPRANDPWVLVPGDHPTLDAGVVHRLLAEYASGKYSIVVPTLAGKRGHPTVLAWRHVEGIRALPPNTGLNRYLREYGSETLELPVTEPSVLCDLDTPEDYDRLQALFEHMPDQRGASLPPKA